MIDKLHQYILYLHKQSREHRRIVNELHYSKNDRLDDRKYHDGSADAYNVARIKMLDIFRKELKPCDLIENIDDLVDLDKEED